MTLNLCSLAIGTRLACRDKSRARLLANDVKGIAPCVIAVEVGPDMEQLHNVDADGVISEGSEHPHDIVGIPSDAGRVEPVYGWAAVAPDGTIGVIAKTELQVWMGMHCATQPARDSAYRAGWRVIRVQISPAGESEEACRGNG